MNLTRPAHVDAAPPAPASAPERIGDRGKLTPLASDRVALQVALARSTADQLRYAQALLGHAVAPGDVAAVIDRALNALVEQLEKRRFTKCARVSATRRASHDPRHIHAHVRREVFEPDGGCCTFVSADGHVCASQRDLEFDHHVPVARGGRATATNVRLRCSTHNQHAADLAFGAGLMQAKQEEARVRRAAPGGCDHHEAATPTGSAADMGSGVSAHAGPWALTSAPTSAGFDPGNVGSASFAPDTRVPSRDPVTALDPDGDLTRALRNLGARRDEISRALEAAAQLQDEPIEKRLNAALRTLLPAGVRKRVPASTGERATRQRSQSIGALENGDAG